MDFEGSGRCLIEAGVQSWHLPEGLSKSQENLVQDSRDSDLAPRRHFWNGGHAICICLQSLGAAFEVLVMFQREKEIFTLRCLQPSLPVHDIFLTKRHRISARKRSGLAECGLDSSGSG
jgi:hypothetical protein